MQDIVFQDPDIQAKRAFEHDPANRIIVADELHHPSEFVTLAKSFAKESRSVDQYGRTTLWRCKPCLDIRVSPKTFARALKLLDAFIKACDIRKYKVDIDTSEYPITYVGVFGERINIRLTEKVKRNDLAEAGLTTRRAFGNTYEYEPLGQLVLEVVELGIDGYTKRWSDSAKSRLEDQLNDVMVGLAVIGKVMKLQRQRREEEHRRWQEKENRRVEEEKRQAEAEMRFQELERQAQLWKRAHDLSGYIAACAQAMRKKSGRIQPESAEAKWLAWARNQVKLLDPIRSGALDGLIKAEPSR
jgi:hypothetical protein